MEMDVQQIGEMARSFVKDSSCAVRELILKFGNNTLLDGLDECVHELMVANNETTESAFILLEHNKVWDATILLRTIIDGTAKLCYLLTARDFDEERRRMHEFRDLVPRREMGAIFQRVLAMKRSPFHRGGAMGSDPVIDPLYRQSDRDRPKDGEGRFYGDIMKKWEFIRISSLLRKDCPEWGNLADLWEYRYAMSNTLVHKSDNGCGQIVERKDREMNYRTLSDLAHAASLFMDISMLFHTRGVVLSRRLNVPTASLVGVLDAHKFFFDQVQEVCEKFAMECQTR